MDHPYIKGTTPNMGGHSTNNKRILTERPSPNNIKHQIFGSNNKTMKQRLDDGDTTYCDPLLNVPCYEKNIYYDKKLNSTTKKL